MKRFLFAAALLIFLVSLGSAAGPSVSLDVKKIKTEPVPLETSEYADVWVKIVNNGGTVSQNTVVRFRPEFPFSVDPEERTEWNLGDVHPGEEYRLHFQVKVDENAIQGNNTLKFALSSRDGFEVTDTIKVEVRTDDEALVIEDVEFPEKVQPGTSRRMDLTVTNLADSYLKNIDISLDIGSDDLPFVTSGTSRERIQKLESGSSATVSFLIHTDSDAENGAYKIPLDIEYENEAGSDFSREELTGIVVGGESLLDVGVEERELNRPGSTGRVTLRIVNRGDGSARYVNLVIPPSEDYEVVSSDSIYLGNMDPDDYQTAEFTIYAERGLENITLPAQVTYTSSGGDQRSEVQDVSLDLYSGNEIRRYGLSGGGSTFLIPAVLVLLVVAGFYYWKRRKGR